MMWLTKRLFAVVVVSNLLLCWGCQQGYPLGPGTDATLIEHPFHPQDKLCTSDSQCDSRNCVDGVCQEPPAPPVEQINPICDPVQAAFKLKDEDSGESYADHIGDLRSLPLVVPSGSSPLNVGQLPPSKGAVVEMTLHQPRRLHLSVSESSLVAQPAFVLLEAPSFAPWCALNLEEYQEFVSFESAYSDLIEPGNYYLVVFGEENNRVEVDLDYLTSVTCEQIADWELAGEAAVDYLVEVSEGCGTLPAPNCHFESLVSAQDGAGTIAPLEFSLHGQSDDLSGPAGIDVSDDGHFADRLFKIDTDQIAEAVDAGMELEIKVTSSSQNGSFSLDVRGGDECGAASVLDYAEMVNATEGSDDEREHFDDTVVVRALLEDAHEYYVVVKSLEADRFDWKSFYIEAYLVEPTL